MKRIFIGLTVCLFLLSCSKKKENISAKNKPYIISQENNRQIIHGDTIPPQPIPGFLVYGTNTFIIDSDSSTIYYFKRGDVGHICGNWGRGDTIPYFINLQPKDLIQIPTNSISNFIKLNYKDHFRNMTFIASKSDTLKTNAYFDLVNALRLSLKEKDIYFMRRTTQEEDTVLKYKKNNHAYYSEDIKWDKNRITFPFTKPKI